MKPLGKGPIVLWGARVLSAGVIATFALGYPVPVPVLQMAELLTVGVNTLLSVAVVGLVIVVLCHAFFGTRLVKEPKRDPRVKTTLGLVFAFELAAFALIGWWFTVALRVAVLVVLKTAPYEKD